MCTCGRSSTAASTGSWKERGSGTARQSKLRSRSSRRTSWAKSPLPCTTGKAVIRSEKAKISLAARACMRGLRAVLLVLLLVVFFRLGAIRMQRIVRIEEEVAEAERRPLLALGAPALLGQRLQLQRLLAEHAQHRL